MLKTLLAVGMGSFTGGILRYLVSRYVRLPFLPDLPWATLIVNVLGCLLIGILYGLFDRGQLLHTHLRLFLTVGVCGGFTTFSTFMNENLQLLKAGDFFYLTIYSGLSLVLGLIMVYLGSTFVKLI